VHARVLFVFAREPCEMRGLLTPTNKAASSISTRVMTRLTATKKSPPHSMRPQASNRRKAPAVPRVLFLLASALRDSLGLASVVSPLQSGAPPWTAQCVRKRRTFSSEPPSASQDPFGLSSLVLQSSEENAVYLVLQSSEDVNSPSDNERLTAA
jgi:hypothetical protein